MKAGSNDQLVRALTLDRRRFLALGAAGLLTPRVSSWALTEPAAVAVVTPTIGYLEGSGELPSLRDLPWAGGGQNAADFAPVLRTVVPAAEMPLGDQDLVSRSVEVTVHGFFPGRPPELGEGIESVELHVLFPSPHPLIPGPLPFIAWQGRTRPAPNPGQRVRFPVPVGADGRLEMVLEVETSEGLGGRALRRGERGSRMRRRFPASFTVDWYDGEPKLMRGIYLLGLRPGTWDREAEIPGPGTPGRRKFRSLVLSVEPLAEEP
jgi:hypothetical protein